MVVNPEDRFSHNEAHFTLLGFGTHLVKTLHEPCREKTYLRGFRTGPTQTGLNNTRFKISGKDCRGPVLSM